MRILYLHQFFATRESSLGLIRSYEFSRRMIAEGHEVIMVTSASRLPAEFNERSITHGEIDGIDVRSVRVAYSNYMGTWRRMLSFAHFMIGATWLAIRAPKPDVVFATSTPLTIGIPGWIAAAWHRVPFVFEVRDLWPEAAIQMGAISRGGFIGRVAKGLERFLYHRATDVIALSPGMAAGVIAEGKDPDRVHMVPNSCDLDLFSPGPKDPQFVEKYGLAGKFVVGYAGAIGPSNAVEQQVVPAAAELKRRGRDDIVFFIIGDGKSVPTFKEQIAEQELDNVVLAGEMPKKEIPRVTRTSDVVMALFADKPILATNSPNKFFDGLASGRPVLVNSPGWTRELVEEHEVGAYVPQGDGVATAEALIRIADDDALRERMGENALALAKAQFGRDELAHKVIAVLERAAEQHGHPKVMR
ncbi:MAG: glycosyltransferase family 4 protein [Coriobacteriales bacterium]|nr:glycosyltransferase family 4 protein [Coriobacteriales bacterium]